MIRGGRSHVSAPPAFSNDGKKLLVCTGNDVTIFSTSTGLQVSALEGHVALVTSVVVEPVKSPGSKVLCYCWTAALDGTIRYWDFAVPELMKTVDIKVPVFSMVIPSLFSQHIASSNSRPDLFAYISIENMNEESHPNVLHGQVRKCNLTKSNLAGLIMKETKRPPYICMSPAGDFCSIINKRKLHIWKIPEADALGIAPIKVDFHHTRDLTVCAFHHTQKIVAAGDVSGRILIWRGFGIRAFSKGVGRRSITDDGERPGVRGEDDADSCSTWHWHSTAVNVLSFSSDGAYLFSGGAEGVLVVWQLDTGKKKFLPRIGSPLLYYVDSPDPLLASVSCADNQIHFLKLPYMEILKSISGIKLPISLPKPYDCLSQSCAFDNNEGLLALRTENYAIQIYSLFDDREVAQIQVCERNHQPGDEITVFVTKIALSWDGSLLSTVEVRLPEEDVGGLVCLKFWMSDSLSNQFKLSTVIYEPHRECQISALAFRPAKRMVCTTSDGGDFKTWVQNDAIQPKEEKVPNSGWICHAVGSYKKKPMTAAAFSNDGSILAVAAASVITLWDPENNVLITVVGDSHMSIKALSFVGHSGLLLSASGGSKPQLDIWSLKEFSRLWSYSLQVEGVVCSDDASTYAVLALLPKNGADYDEAAFGWRDGVILVFMGTSHVPAATWSVRKAERGAISFLKAKPEEHVLDGKQPKLLVAFVNGDHEYVLFDPFGDETSEHGVKRLFDSSVEEKENFGYTSVYGNLKELEMRDHKSAETELVPTGKDWSAIFSWSSHDPPPLTKVCSEFLESLLERRQTVSGS